MSEKTVQLNEEVIKGYSEDRSPRKRDFHDTPLFAAGFPAVCDYQRGGGCQ